MSDKGELLYISPKEISPCPYQTRQIYRRKDMESLIASVKENGILQPLTATKTDEGYQLISGHRRLFAASVLNLETVPVIVMEKTAEQIAVLCAVENLHREDLNFFEQAEAIRLLIDILGLTQAEAGQRLSLSQSAVANKLRILQLKGEVRKLIIRHGLTERHARALCRLPADKQMKTAEYIVKRNLNVSESEKHIEKLLAPKSKDNPKHKTVVKIKDVRLFTNTVTRALGIMKKAGFKPSFEENTTETSVEYRIVIPLR